MVAYDHCIALLAIPSSLAVLAQNWCPEKQRLENLHVVWLLLLLILMAVGPRRAMRPETLGPRNLHRLGGRVRPVRPCGRQHVDFRWLQHVAKRFGQRRRQHLAISPCIAWGNGYSTRARDDLALQSEYF